MTATSTSGNASFEAQRIRDYEYVARNGGYKLIFGLAYSILGNAQDAEDVTQETFVRAWRRLETYDRTHPILHWMSSITRNQIRDLYRRHRSRPTASLDALREAGFKVPQTVRSVDPVAAVLDMELGERIHEAVALLPKHFNEPLTLHLLRGRSYSEISQILGCPMGTVRSRMHRGRALLRHLLKDYFPSSAPSSF